MRVKLEVGVLDDESELEVDEGVEMN